MRSASHVQISVREVDPKNDMKDEEQSNLFGFINMNSSKEGKERRFTTMPKRKESLTRFSDLTYSESGASPSKVSKSNHTKSLTMELLSMRSMSDVSYRNS